MQPTILITRPEGVATVFADQLRARLGCDVPITLSPLMRIEFCGELPDLTMFRTLIFTSRNGVAAFAALSDRRDLPCYTVGGGTAKAAQSQGLVARSANGAADDLIEKIIAENPPGPLLHVRGEHGAGDVANRLTAAGCPTSTAILYRQIHQPATQVARDLLQGKAPVIVPLFSPRSAQILFAEGGKSTCLWIAALSQNVADMVPEGHARAVTVAENPDADAMLDTVIALVEIVKSLEGRYLSQ